MSRYIYKTGKGRYTLTTAGSEYVEANRETVNYLFSGVFSCEEQLSVSGELEKAKQNGKKLLIYPEDERIREGELIQKNSTARKRSAKLRKAAIDYYKAKDGELRCAVCGFSFQDTYGELGEDFIEMHHEKPLYQYEEEELESYFPRAVQNMKPLCANCHRMIHRNRNQVLTVAQLKEIIKKH